MRVARKNGDWWLVFTEKEAADFTLSEGDRVKFVRDPRGLLFGVDRTRDDGSNVKVRRAGEGDLAPLGAVAPAAYAAAYHSLWPQASELARHLQSFGEAGLRAFLAKPGSFLWIAEEDGMPVGFLTLLLGSDDPVDGCPGGAEIPRIFLLPNVRGRGVGRRLFEVAREEAVRRGARYLWLDAMDSADWAIGAYEKWGFTRIGTTTFPKPVAPEHAGMAVLRMELG